MSEAPSNRMLNRLRAAVLGANDGIVSTSSVVMGVAGASASNKTIFTAGMAALVAGALSMAVGEYVSVGSQKDAERSHAESIGDEDMEYTSPTQAAVASFVAFSVGGVIPFLAVIFASDMYKIIATVLAVIISLVVMSIISARFTKTPFLRPMLRIVIGGLIAMAITYYVGTLFGTAIG